MPEVTLQSASLLEIPQIRELAIATWSPTYKDILSKEQLYFMQEEIYAEDSLRNQINQGQEFYFIRSNAGVVGFLSVSKLDKEAGIFKLNKIYLLPEKQGSGFGIKALREAEKVVRQKNGRCLQLNVNRYNKAKAFYEKCGYSVIREEDIPIGKYWMSDYVMQKNLSGN